MKQGTTLFSNWIRALLLLAIIALLSGGAWFYRDQEQSIQKRIEEDLSAVARLKADQIAAWRNDQLEDAVFLQLHPFLPASVLRFMADKSEENTHELRVRFRNLADQHGHAGILLVAPDGKPLLSLLGTVEGHRGYLPALSEALRDGKPAFTELHMEGPDDSPHISVVVPLYKANGPGTEPFAAMVLTNDASRFLYPLVQFWPTPRETAETLLVRRDGDEVLFLNDLRHQPDTALKLRVPLSRTDVPAVMAVLGRQGVFQGKDYRGVEVVSVILPVPDSSWFMISKIDAAEAFAEWRFRSVMMLGLLFGLTACIVAAGLVLWQRDKKAQYRALYLSEAALRENVERHSITLKAIGDAVISTDARGIVELLNPPAEILTGWKQDEARGRPLGEVFHIVNEETRELSEDPVTKVLREGLVVGLANHTVLIAKDGTERPIADSGAPIRDEKGEITGVVLVFRDQSAEREAQNALQKSEARYRETLDGMIEGCQIIGPDWRYVYVNDAAARHGRKARDELLGKTMMEVYPDIEKTDFFEVLRQAMKDRHPQFLENELNYPEGDRGYFELRIEPVPEGLFILSIDITGRRLAEQELQRSTERQRFLADIIENAQQPLAVGYPDGGLGVFNRAFCELTGYDREELKAIDWNETLTPPEWRQMEVEALEETARDGKPVRYEKEYLRKDGTRVPVELLVHIIKDETGAVQYYYAFVTDITQRKRKEEKIRHLTQVLRALRNVNHLITHEKDRDRLLRRTCEILTEARGFKSAWIGVRDPAGAFLFQVESGIGEHFNAMRTDLERGSFPECWHKAMEETGVVVMRNTSISCRQCPLNSAYRDASTLAGALRHSGRNYGVLVAAIPADLADDVEEHSLFMELVGDIGYALYGIETNEERERVVAALRDSESRYRALFEGSADGILIADIETRKLKYANPAMSRLLGYTEAELTKINMTHIHPEEDLPRIMADFEAQIQGKNTLAQNIPCRRKDGAIVFADVNAAPIIIDGRSCVVGFFRDTSERTRAEKENEKLQAQLIQAQKMEAVGRLAGGVAHDYNNILSVIIGYSEMALIEAEPGDPLHEYLKEIHTAAERSRDITRQLLAFARKETIMPEVLDLNANLESMLKILRKLIGEDIHLEYRPGKVLWPVLMDPSQLDQIIANLCVNARDAIADVGRITIETEALTIEEDYCSTHVGFIPGDFVRISVSDDGCGMDRKTVDKIFEPFFTTKGMGKGTGLGLSTVYGIVKQNNGFLNVYSEPGQGTTFRIYLPGHSGDSIEKPRQADEEVVKGNGETVLVVEDDTSILKMAQRILTHFGYKVLSSKNPQEALKSAQTHSHQIALLITDVVMPGMNGRELAEKMKVLYPGIKCLYMSGYTANVIAHRGVLDRGFQFIQKPFTMKGLAAKVRDALDMKSEMS